MKMILLYCIDEQTMKSRVQTRVQMRLCVPKQIRKQVMQAVHSGVLAAHPGIVRMMDKMKMYVWWPGMHADIVQYVTHCVTCQKGEKNTCKCFTSSSDVSGKALATDWYRCSWTLT